MATDLEPQTKPVPKYETFVEQQLARARRRIRALDAAAVFLVLLLGTLAYCLLVTLLDRALDLPLGVRLTAFLAYACVAVIYLGWAGLGLWSRRINPYYAAQQIEHTLPDAKNSVVNWLDLRGANLPPVIRGALGQRAARDLKQADLDRAISTRRTTWLGGSVLGLLAVVLVLCLLGGGQFLSLLERAFTPFQEVAIASRTTLEILDPQGGDVTVPVGRPVTFRVHVAGRVPAVNQRDALRLQYRYNPTDPYVTQGMEQDVDGEWTATLLADQVQGGLWYKISGGDAETPEYQVRVRSQVQVTGFDVTYHYRPYRNRKDRVAHYPNQDAVAPHLAAHQGTEVTLSARANRLVREGHLEMDLGGVQKELPAIAPAVRPEVMRFHFTLEKSGSYRVLFTDVDHEANTDRASYRIDVLADRAPQVQLTRPGKDVELPANGTLSLEGRAEDDFGITKMSLHLRVSGGPVLQAKPYRAGKSFRLDNGDYPDALDYKDFIELEKLKTDAGVAFPLASGMEVKYWLEANDNCDYPKKTGNVGRSKEYAVKVIAPAANQQQEQERKQAQQTQKQHEQRQDQKLEKQSEQARAKAAQQDGQGEDPKDNPGQPGAQQQKEFANKARQLENALKEKEKEDNSKGQVKRENAAPSQGASKDRGQEEQGANPAAAKKEQPSANQDPGTQKDQGQKGAQAPKGQSKDGGQPEAGTNGAQSPGQARDGGNENAADKKASAKNDSAGLKQGSDAQGAKGAGKQQPKEQVGQGKDQGQAGQATAAGQAKDGGQKAANQQRAEGKNGGKDQEVRAARGDAKAGTPKEAGDAKAAPQDQVGQARGDRGSGQKTDASQAKGAGQPETGKQQSAPGQVKGQNTSDNKGMSKAGGTEARADQQKGSARDAGGSGASSPRAESKKTAPDQARTAGEARPDRSSPGQRDAQQNAPPKDATQEDVARLKDALKKGDQKQAAADELSRIAQEARDPQVRKGAEDALKEADARVKGPAHGQDPGMGQAKSDSGKRKGQGPVDQTGQSGEKPPADSNVKEKTPGNPGGEAGNTSTAKGNPGDKTHAGGVPTSPGNGNFDDKYRQEAGNEDFVRRGGVLQLEELKKKITPDILKKLNWTDKDWQQFLEQARRYEAAGQPREPLAGKEKIRPGSSLLPSTGPRRIGADTDARTNDFTPGQALPPPEFRDAQRIFTSRPESGSAVPGKN